MSCGGATAAGAKFVAQEVSLSPPQNPSNGLRKLMLEVSIQAPARGQLEVHLQLAAAGGAMALSPAVNELGSWSTDGPFRL